MWVIAIAQQPQLAAFDVHEMDGAQTENM